MHPQTPRCVSWGLKELREAQAWYTTVIDTIANIKAAVIFLSSSYIVREAKGFLILIENLTEKTQVLWASNWCPFTAEISSLHLQEESRKKIGGDTARSQEVSSVVPVPASVDLGD